MDKANSAIGAVDSPPLLSAPIRSSLAGAYQDPWPPGRSRLSLLRPLRAATDRALRVHLDQTVGSATPGSAPGLTPPLHLTPKLGVLERGEQ
jgi:hypothetical protein